MNHEEAVALRQAHLHGRHVAPRQLEQALQVINRGNTISHGRNDTWRAEPVHEALRDRTNAVLVYRLALACGLLKPWSPA